MAKKEAIDISLSKNERKGYEWEMKAQPKCKICGSTNKIQPHHISYEPEEVIQLCSLHHFCLGDYVLYIGENQCRKKTGLSFDEVYTIRDKYREFLQRQKKDETPNLSLSEVTKLYTKCPKCGAIWSYGYFLKYDTSGETKLWQCLKCGYHEEEKISDV